jgi:iron complex transport system substrate-binding protein
MRSAWLRADTMLVRLLVVIAGIACVLAVVACGSDDDGVGDNSTEVASSDASHGDSENGGDYPIELDTKWGTSTLDSKPKKIVALSVADYQLLTALGVSPVMSVDVSKNANVSAPDILNAKGEEDIFSGSPFSDNAGIEDIASQNPDLIVSTAPATESIYAKLTEIAPVFSLSEGQNSKSDWRDKFTRLAEAVGESDRASSFIEDIDSKFEYSRNEISAKGNTVSVLFYYGPGTGMILNTPGTNTADLLDNMGFSSPDFAGMTSENESGVAGKISDEVIPRLESDYLIVVGSDQSIDELHRQNVFEMIPAVKQGKTLEIDSPRNAEGPVMTTINGKTFDGSISKALVFNGPLDTKYILENLTGPLSDMTASR